MGLTSHFDFAEDDYRFLCDCLRRGIHANSMGAMAVQVCERYLKHVIEECSELEGFDVPYDIMGSHNLCMLEKYIDKATQFHIPDELHYRMRSIASYYYTTKYPCGSIDVLDRDDIRECVQVAGECRDAVRAILRDIETIRLDKLADVER